jgi:hypothetical protein
MAHTASGASAVCRSWPRTCSCVRIGLGCCALRAKAYCYNLTYARRNGSDEGGMAANHLVTPETLG